MKFKVGQRLWWVPVNTWTRPTGDEGQWATVSKVGPKWVTLNDSFRVDAAVLRKDGFDHGPTGRCYLSHEDYKDHLFLDKEWKWLKRMFPTSAPPHLTVDSIRLIASVLKLDPRESA